MADQSLDILIKFGLSDAAAKEAIAELNKIGAATSAVADESARYQAALEKMAAADTEAARDDRLKALRGEIAARRKLAEEADAQIAAENKATPAMQESAKAIDRATVSHKDLKAAVRGLHGEFPLLSRAAHMALNPITLGVAGIAAAFGIWRTRTSELARTLSQVELPNLSPEFLTGLEHQAKAWNSVATAVGKAVEAYNSVESASDRIAISIKKQAEHSKELLEAKHGLELAELDASDASAPDKLTKRLEIDARYRKAGLEIDKQTAHELLAAQHVKKANLEIDARSKADAADKIKIGTEAQDDLTEAEHKRRADAARADIEERKKRIQEAEDFSADSFLGKALSVPSLFKFGSRYGYDVKTEDVGKVAQQIEGGVIASEQPIVDRYDNFVLQRRNRRKIQERREDLTQQAAQEFSAAASIGMSLPAQKMAAIADADHRSQVEAVNSLKEIANYHRELVDAINATARDVKQTSSRLTHRNF